jgi:hypothetical protein
MVFETRLTPLDSYWGLFYEDATPIMHKSKKSQEMAWKCKWHIMMKLGLHIASHYQLDDHFILNSLQIMHNKVYNMCRDIDL